MHSRPRLYIYEDKVGGLAHGAHRMSPSLVGGTTGEWYMPVADSEERLKEVERQRDTAVANLREFAGPALREAVASYSTEKLARKRAEVALAEREEQVKEALEPVFDLRDWCRRESKAKDEEVGTRAEAYKIVAGASLWDRADALRRLLTQPSSNPPQQDREELFTDSFCDRVLSELVTIAGGRPGYTSDSVPFARWDMKAALRRAAQAEPRKFSADETLTGRELAEAALTQPEADPEVPRCGEDRWQLGDVLQHPCGSRWELIEHIGGEHDDWRGRCVQSHWPKGPAGRGEQLGVERTFHREYMDRTFTRVLPDCQPTPELLGEEK
jgi:hypothetical protein